MCWLIFDLSLLGIIRIGLFFFFSFLLIPRPPRSTLSSSSAASDVYKRQAIFELCDAPFAITLGARGDEAIHAGGPCRTGSAPISMDGRAVFRFAVDALPRCLHAVLDETQLALDDVDWVVCHQANSRIIDHCVKALHADAAKFYKNMDRHGNTSAASIPVALNEMAEAGLLKAGQKVSCIGFGGGLTWGGMLVTYSPLSHG